MNKRTQTTALVGLILLLASYQPVAAHGGDDHGATTAPGGKASRYFTSQAISDKYELVLHYEPLRTGEAGKLRLYINEFNTNQPVEGATLQLSSPEADKLALTVKPTGGGIYELTGTFPAKKTYSLTVSLNAKPGADLMLLPGIEVGKDLPVAAATSPVQLRVLILRNYHASEDHLRNLLKHLHVAPRRDWRASSGQVTSLCEERQQVDSTFELPLWKTNFSSDVRHQLVNVSDLDACV